MQKVTLDQSLRAKLNGLTTQIELCDDAGQTIGYFLPAEWHRQLLYAWAKAQVTDEELEQARQEPGGSSLAEILEKLEKGCATQ